VNDIYGENLFSHIPWYVPSNTLAQPIGFYQIGSDIGGVGGRLTSAQTYGDFITWVG
jgi:hypothetical protein